MLGRLEHIRNRVGVMAPGVRVVVVSGGHMCVLPGSVGTLLERAGWADALAPEGNVEAWLVRLDRNDGESFLMFSSEVRAIRSAD